MLDLLTPIKVDSLKEACVTQLEALILSGRWQVGQKLPSQRLLAKHLGVSRPIVHEALIFLAGKGMIKMVPRVGAVVEDYRKEGSLAVLTSLFRGRHPELSPRLIEGLLAIRALVEIETARLAALYRSQEHISELKELISAEEQTSPEQTQTRADLDYAIHHQVALAGGNEIYPLLLNFFKPIYISLLGLFYQKPEVAATSVGFHRDLLDAIKNQDDQLAVAAMRCLLAHGEENLKRFMAQQQEKND